MPFDRQLTEWLAHVPKEVLAKNFKTNMTAIDHIPAEQLYIFPSGTPCLPCLSLYPPNLELTTANSGASF